MPEKYPFPLWFVIGATLFSFSKGIVSGLVMVGFFLIMLVGAKLDEDWRTERMIKQMRDPNTPANRKAAWESKVIDRQLEEDLSDSIQYGGADYDVAWDAVARAYLQMPFHREKLRKDVLWYEELHAESRKELYGEDIKIKQVNLRSIEEVKRALYVVYDKSPHAYALTLMMAQRGKLPVADIEDFSFLPRAETRKEKAGWNRKYEFWMYVQDLLRENGVEEARLVFRVGLFEYRSHYDIQVYDAEKQLTAFHYLIGHLHWLQELPYDDNLIPI